MQWWCNRNPSFKIQWIYLKMFLRVLCLCVSVFWCENQNFCWKDFPNNKIHQHITASMLLFVYFVCYMFLIFCFFFIFHFWCIQNASDMFKHRPEFQKQCWNKEFSGMVLIVMHVHVSVQNIALHAFSFWFQAFWLSNVPLHLLLRYSLQN